MVYPDPKFLISRLTAFHFALTNALQMYDYLNSKKALFLLFYEHHCTFILTLLLGTSLHCVYMHELYKALQVCSFMPDFYSTISAEHNEAKTFVKSQYDS